jgi:hypothetical protein
MTTLRRVAAHEKKALAEIEEVLAGHNALIKMAEFAVTTATLDRTAR